METKNKKQQRKNKTHEEYTHESKQMTIFDIIDSQDLTREAHRKGFKKWSKQFSTNNIP